MSWGSRCQGLGGKSASRLQVFKVRTRQVQRGKRHAQGLHEPKKRGQLRHSEAPLVLRERVGVDPCGPGELLLREAAGRAQHRQVKGRSASSTSKEVCRGMLPEEEARAGACAPASPYALRDLLGGTAR